MRDSKNVDFLENTSSSSTSEASYKEGSVQVEGPADMVEKIARRQYRYKLTIFVIRLIAGLLLMLASYYFGGKLPESTGEIIQSLLLSMNS